MTNRLVVYTGRALPPLLGFGGVDEDSVRGTLSLLPPGGCGLRPC
ncbi:hypothetical protein J2S43_007012 [Catenuloplanes nepalensis]|uniref:Uncharacterized protein n=1 Tax=Catenuloplanes nepalensis TaxID=587533 RepID=A0ABT9N468_9ACTN|nr:hypothetical protein [Catenuloplanes nepalensis]